MLNPQYLLGDHNYGIQFYQRLKNTSQSFSILKLNQIKTSFYWQRGGVFLDPRNLQETIQR